MKAMISQRMMGKSDEEIIKTREKAVAYLEGQGYEVVNTYFTDDIEGSAGVTPQGGDEQMLVPGQQISIFDAQFSIQDADTDPFTAWRDGYFYYDQESLRDILMQLGRSYNLNIEVHRRSLLDLHLRYIIPRNSTPEYAVRKLNELMKESVTLNGNTIVVG